MKFDVKGPFELPREDSDRIDASSESKREYWEWIEESCPGLPDACGCYVFTVGSLPWYVGKTERQTFKKESLNYHKLDHFNKVISKRKKGRPALFFLPQLTAANRYRKPTNTKRPAIQELESLLIGMALNRNNDLQNVSGTKWLNQLTVTGFLNDRMSPRGPAKKLRDLFNT